MTYDLDYTAGNNQADFGGVEGYQYDTFKHMERGKKRAPTNLFISLFQNDSFKTKFEKIYEEYAYYIMALERVNPIIEEFYGDFTFLLSNSQTRWWGYFGGSKEENLAYAKNNFQNKILPKTKKFFEERPKYAIEQMKQYIN